MDHRVREAAMAMDVLWKTMGGAPLIFWAAWGWMGVAVLSWVATVIAWFILVARLHKRLALWTFLQHECGHNAMEEGDTLRAQQLQWAKTHGEAHAFEKWLTFVFVWTLIGVGYMVLLRIAATFAEAPELPGDIAWAFVGGVVATVVAWMRYETPRWTSGNNDYDAMRVKVIDRIKNIYGQKNTLPMGVMQSLRNRLMSRHANMNCDKEADARIQSHLSAGEFDAIFAMLKLSNDAPDLDALYGVAAQAGADKCVAATVHTADYEDILPLRDPLNFRPNAWCFSIERSWVLAWIALWIVFYALMHAAYVDLTPFAIGLSAFVVLVSVLYFGAFIFRMRSGT